MSQAYPFAKEGRIHFAVLQQIVEHLKAASVNDKREAGDNNTPA